MPRQLIKAPGADRSRSLGFLATWWIETFIVQGPGDVEGDPIVHGDEFTGFIVDCYILDSDGRRMHDSAFFSRPKGCNKSGVAAELVLFEALGPCRFAGWAKGGETFEILGHTYTYSKGEPMGKPVKYPFVRIMATEDGQTGNTYDMVFNNLEDGPLSALKAYGMRVNRAKVDLPFGGEIIPSTSGSASKDGGKETFVVFDEALTLDTLLPTPDGYTTMGDVRVGDYLVGSDGTPVRVLKTTEPMVDRRVFKVTFDDGSSIKASEGHLWETRFMGSGAAPRVRTTDQIRQSLDTGRRVAIPRSNGFIGQETDLPIDPYVLGMWLGDGSKDNAAISVAWEHVEETKRLIEARGYTAKVLKAQEGKAARIYVSLPGSTSNRFSKVDGLKVKLGQEGLLGNKHIPLTYLRASVAQRIALLQGLMDSDGHIDKKGHCTWVQTDQGLVDSFVELLHSLGQSPRTIFVNDERSRQGGYYKVHFTSRNGLTPVSLDHKAERLKDRQDRDWQRVVKIQEIESVPVKCVAVDSEDHLFAAGWGWNMTHNTHLYNTKMLHQMYDTVSRNLNKRKKIAETWALETTTMYLPGEDSVAEDTYNYAQAIFEATKALEEGETRKVKVKRARMLFDHRWGDVVDMEDEEKLGQAIEEAYGEALDWNSKQGIIDDLYDPRRTPEESRRYFLNALTEAHNSWTTPQHMARSTALGVEVGATISEIAEGEKISLGFDGAVSNDATALIGCRISDGALFKVKIEEKPDGPDGENWIVDFIGFDAKVAYCFDRFTVVAFFADPPHWQDYIDKWDREYGEGLAVKAGPQSAIKWWTKRDIPMALALERLHQAISLSPGTPIDPDPVLVRHFINARRWDRRGGTVIGKDTKNSVKKIDGAMGATLAYEARAFYLAKAPVEKPTFVPRRVR